MTSRFEVWVDDVALSSIDPSIRIMDILYFAPTSTKGNTYGYGGRPGGILIPSQPTGISCTVTFVVREYDPVRRQGIFADIRKWATTYKNRKTESDFRYGINGDLLRKVGLLKTIDRPGQMLLISSVDVPVVSSAQNWTQTVQITFTSVIPYWMDEEPTTIYKTPEYTGIVDFAHETRGNADAILPSMQLRFYQCAVLRIRDSAGIINEGVLKYNGAGNISIGYDTEGKLTIDHPEYWLYPPKPIVLHTGYTVVALQASTDYGDTSANVTSITLMYRGGYV